MTIAVRHLSLSVFSRLSTGLFWNASASLASQGGMFVTTLIAANTLGVSQFGEFSLVLLTVLAVVGITLGSVSTTATRYVAELRVSDKIRAGKLLALCYLSSLVLALAGTLVVALASEWIGSAVLDSPSLRSSLVLGAGIVLFGVISAFQAGALSGLEAFRSLAIIQSICAVLQILLCWWLATTMGLIGLFIGLVLASACRCLLLGLLLQKECLSQGIRLGLADASKELGILRRFGFPALLIGIVANLAQWLVFAILARKAGATELGLFNAANNLRSLILFVPFVFQPVVLTFLSSPANGQRAAMVYWSNIGFAICVTALLGGAVVAVAPAILGLYGSGFGDARVTLQILMIAAVFEAAYFAAYQVLLTRESIWFSLFAVNTPWALSLVIVAHVLVPAGGSRSLAIAFCIAWFVALAVVLACVTRRASR